MLEFSPGESRTAIAPMSNPTAKAFSYTAELYLGLPKAASSGVISFSLAPGETRNIRFPVTMPAVEGTFPVYLDVYAEGTLIGAYQATEDVVITTPIPFDPWVYDINGSCYIETEEVVQASNDYFAGIITKEQLDQVSYLWQNDIRNPACAPPTITEFAYVSEINQVSCICLGPEYISPTTGRVRRTRYSAKGITVSVKNLSQYLQECHITRIYTKENGGDWVERDIPSPDDVEVPDWTTASPSVVIEPGETITFCFCIYRLRSYTFSYYARIVGDPGVIEGGRFTVRHYA